MSTPVRAGLLLGVAVVVWTFVMGFTGWYKDPALVNAFFLVVLFELGLLIWMLRQTAAAGATWGQQVLNGVVFSLVASVLVFVGSYLFTTVAFPSYFEDIRAVQTQMLRSQGLTEPDIAAQVQAAAATQTPVMNALSGVMGTVVTGVVVSAIAGFFIRAKTAK